MLDNFWKVKGLLSIGSNSNQADSILNFSTLGVVSAAYSQVSASGQFSLQGNDIPGTLTLALSPGSLITVNGAVGWRVTALRICAFCREPGHHNFLWRRPYRV